MDPIPPRTAVRAGARPVAAWRLAELTLLYLVLPLLVRARLIPLPRLAVLALVTGYAVLVLSRDRFFDLASLWRGRLRPHLPGVLASAALAGAVIAALVLRLAPDRLLALPRERPAAWALGLLLYPLLSAWPQEVLYRAFFFRRYAVLFPGRTTMVTASALAFAVLHLVYPNLVAPLLSLPAGLLLARRFRPGDGLAPVWLEHGLYGLLLFTLGLGQFFYDGRG
jgi:hypothetical protein